VEQRYRTAGRLSVRRAGTGSGQAEVKTGKTSKERLGTAGKLEQTRRTGNRQTENTSINTQGIIEKMGDTWRGVETSTRTGETDQGKRVVAILVKCALISK
jgi:hypothetical protein